MIPYGKHNISQEDIDAVVEVLQNGWLTQGPKVQDFEKILSEYVGAEHAVAANSATSCLHVACLALGVGEVDIVWTSPNSFVASSNAALYCGADVDFVDISSKTFNMCTKALEAKLVEAKAQNKLPKVVIPVHIAGQSCNMQRIKELADEYGFKIIEDASHCIGGSYQDKKIGSCEFSDICVFSFHPVKIITTGEGGMATTNDAELKKKMDMFRSHGITRDVEESDGPWYYEQQELGYNYRITDLQCALGVSQMKRLDEFITKRHELAKRYDEELSGLPLKTPFQRSDAYSAYHLYIIQLDDAANRREVFEGLREAEIFAQIHYIPIHTQPYYQGLGFKKGDFPVAEDYYSRAISLPLFPGLTEAEQTKVIETLKGLL